MRRLIDWDRIERRAATYSDDQITAAVAAVNALPPRKDNQNKVDQFWPMPDKMPTLQDLDFRDMKVQKVPLDGLQASNKSLKRDKLVWHVQNPGKAVNPNPFTANPTVLDQPDGPVIVDGHHRLAALKMLGASSALCYVVPPN